mmetsp:Transcript_26736/g.30568  ORF Transcript_26736/g.30568 Transcript_26736/m.30568 type:complete len:187 (-) Transcript_26736:213-773(-)
MIKFTECLNDSWDYFFLGDPAKLSSFKSENNLSDNLISEFTQNNSGDLIVEKGVLIPLSGIANFPYHIIFQINSDVSIFDDDQKNDLQFKRVGYFLEIVNRELYLMTIPYLTNWTDGIIRLESNIRPKVNLENGFYSVEILGGETYHQESGWEPTIEFILQKLKEEEVKLTAEDVNFKFQMKSKEY